MKVEYPHPGRRAVSETKAALPSGCGCARGRRPSQGQRRPDPRFSADLIPADERDTVLTAGFYLQGQLIALSIDEEAGRCFIGGPSQCLCGVDQAILGCPFYDMTGHDTVATQDDQACLWGFHQQPALATGPSRHTATAGTPV